MGYSLLGGRSAGGRQLDLQGAASGSGYGCPDGIPIEIALCGLLAAFGIAFGTLYRAVTVKTAGRRKRSLNLPHDDPLQLLSIIADYFWMGKLILKLYTFQNKLAQPTVHRY